MASNFPTSLDSFTDPTSGSSLASPSHSGQHADLNDAVEKIEAKLGIGSSPASSASANAVLIANGSGSTSWSGLYTSFTPTWTSGLTVGNATQEFWYCRVGLFVHIYGNLTFGSTTSINNVPIMTLPITAETLPFNVQPLGTATLGDSGTATFVGLPITVGPTAMYLFRHEVTGTSIKDGTINATTPFTWTTGDSIGINLLYKAA